MIVFYFSSPCKKCSPPGDSKKPDLIPEKKDAKPSVPDKPSEVKKPEPVVPKMPEVPRTPEPVAPKTPEPAKAPEPTKPKIPEPPKPAPKAPEPPKPRSPVKTPDSPFPTHKSVPEPPPRSPQKSSEPPKFPNRDDALLGRTQNTKQADFNGDRPKDLSYTKMVESPDNLPDRSFHVMEAKLQESLNKGPKYVEQKVISNPDSLESSEAED